MRRKDSDLVRKPARACTREEIVLARNALGKKKRREARPSRPRSRRRSASARRLAQVKVRTSKTHASFTGVPIGELRHLGAALAKLDLPD